MSKLFRNDSLASPSDRPSDLRQKILEYQQNGVKLGWLILPEARQVEIYRGDRPLVAGNANRPLVAGNANRPLVAGNANRPPQTL